MFLLILDIVLLAIACPILLFMTWESMRDLSKGMQWPRYWPIGPIFVILIGAMIYIWPYLHRR